MKSTLRPRQIESMSRLRQSIASGHRRPVLQAPTGFGKTIIGSAIVEGAMSKGNRVVFVAPAVDLIDQTVAAFYREGITDVGVIQADHPMTDWSKPVQVASVQTLARRKRPEADVVVVDECHRMFQSLTDWMADPDWADVPFIGLSATPWSKGMGKVYDDLIITATTDTLIKEGFLSPFRVFAPAHPDLSGVKVTAGDYNQDQLGEVMGESTLVADVISTWLEKGENRPTLCFAVDRAHAKKLCERFIDAGVAAEYQDAFTDRLDRQQIAKRFNSGQTKVVCNVGTLTTGVDWDVRCIILARPTRSEILHVQIIGRGLRTAPGKDNCLILDHSDNHLRLGFVTDIKHERLHDGTRQEAAPQERKEPLPKECSQCSFLKPARVRQCPACGFMPEVQNKTVEGDGELVELTATGRPKKSSDWSMEIKQAWLSAFVTVGQQRGYKEGWASNQYREKFKAWPANTMHRMPGPVPPEVSSWLHSRRIAYAKRKQKEQRMSA